MNETPEIPVMIPVLAVDDIELAITFYKNLGFCCEFSIPNETGNLVHAHLRNGNSVIFLGRLDISHYAGKKRAEVMRTSINADRGIGITLILQVENLLDVYDFVQLEQLQVLAEPADEYYGDRVFFFIDPFGYEWKISQPISET